MNKVTCAALTFHSMRMIKTESKDGCSCCSRAVYSCRCGSKVKKELFHDDNGGCCK